MRIFFGATLPEETKAKIAELQASLHSLMLNARIEKRDKLHITLQFIGDFDERQVDDLYSSALREVNPSTLKSSVVSIVDLDFFPNEKVKRGIWLGCSDDGTLAAVSRRIGTAMRQHGVVPETRAFRPHITIARFGRDSRENREISRIDLQKLIADGKLSAEQFFPTTVALFQSTLSSSGSEYRILHEFPLESKGV